DTSKYLREKVGKLINSKGCLNCWGNSEFVIPAKYSFVRSNTERVSNELSKLESVFFCSIEEY
ncbi:MAG: hypothetical protein OQK82_05550, partial [Candidatus Pacearchaeota archaeon]|nr:hypothetical protein [Candidatus Pacearchaeota archaeon]